MSPCVTQEVHIKRSPFFFTLKNGQMATLETSLRAALTQPELSVMLADSHEGPYMVQFKELYTLYCSANNSFY